MGTRSFKPYTPGTRQATISDFSEITKSKPEKSLTKYKQEPKVVIIAVLSPAVAVAVDISVFIV
jgi:hypothetical protein